MRNSRTSHNARALVAAILSTLVWLPARPASAQTMPPATACDAALANDDLHPQPGMPLETGTQAFSYSAGGPFVSNGGTSVTLNVALNFDPGPDATIRLTALDDACGGPNGQRTVFAYTFSDLAARNAIALDVTTGTVTFNGSEQTASAAQTARYLFVDVWDGALPSTLATHSYLVDLRR